MGTACNSVNRLGAALASEVPSSRTANSYRNLLAQILRADG
jgi:hypothetical protein